MYINRVRNVLEILGPDKQILENQPCDRKKNAMNSSVFTHFYILL